jgi:mannose-6-phosphate isomerase-like protein (cupin superfamily)
MNHVKPTATAGKFKTLAGTRAAQAIFMTLSPGEASDDRPSNEHPNCEQWMFVISGRGTVTSIGKGGSRRSVGAAKGSLVVIRKRERHQIKNTGDEPLRTVNFYIPPAYGRGGQLLPSATR